MKDHTSSQALTVIQKRSGDSQPCLTRSDQTEHTLSYQNTRKKPVQSSSALKGLQNRTFQKSKDAFTTRLRTRYSNDGQTTASIVPFPRSQSYFGRETQLVQLNAHIQSESYQHLVIVYDLGGSGKLALALKLVYRTREEQPARVIFWVPAVSQQTFEKVYRKVGVQLHISYIEDDKADMKRIVKAKLSDNPSPNIWRICQRPRCEEITSDYPSVIQYAISFVKQRFPRSKRIQFVAKFENDDESSVSSNYEENGSPRSSLLSFGKKDLHLWKENNGRSKSWKRYPTLKRCGYQKTIQSCNHLPEVIYKWPSLAKMRLEAARGNQLRRKRHDGFQKATRDGRKSKLPKQTLYDSHEDLVDYQSYHDQTVDRTIHLVTRNDAELCTCIARLVAKVKTSLWETDPRIPRGCATKPLSVLQSFIEDITVNLRLVSYNDLLLLPKFEFWIQKALKFLQRPRSKISTQEFSRLLRYGSILEFGDLILLETLGFLTQRDSYKLLLYFPGIRKNTHHQFTKGHGCTSYQFAELISNTHINKNNPHMSIEWIAQRFHQALRMDISVCRQSWMKQPRTKSQVPDYGTGIKLRRDSVRDGDPVLPQTVKSYKWLPKSAKRRLRKANQKEKTLPEKKQAPLPNNIVPKRLAQWRKRKLERGTDPFTQCQTVWKSFSCGHNQRVICYWCDDAWEKGLTVECQLQQGRQREEDTRIRQYRIPHPCSICPWHEYPALPPTHKWTHRTPVQSLLKPKGRAKPFVATGSNLHDLQCQQLSFDKEYSDPWELVIRRRRRSHVSPKY